MKTDKQYVDLSKFGAGVIWEVMLRAGPRFILSKYTSMDTRSDIPFVRQSIILKTQL